MKIDLESSKTEVLFNPRMDPTAADSARRFLPTTGKYAGHYWIMTSGTTASSTEEKKWVGLSKEAILASAAAVNQHLIASPSDTWLHTLPDFHVGGIGIYARAALIGSDVIKMDKWSATSFCKIAHQKRATLSALVPAQVYDLVAYGAPPPILLRAIIVGGGALSPTLYQKALEKGWPLLPSYGLSECSSQVATAILGSTTPQLQLLPHIDLTITASGYISIKSPSLLTTYAKITPKDIELVDPKIKERFTTEDKGDLNRNILTVLGRGSHFIKIGGESVNLSQLEMLLEEIKLQTSPSCDVALITHRDDRLGQVIHLLTTSSEVDTIIEAFNSRVMPFECIRNKVLVESIPRTPLGKLKRTPF